MTGTLAPPSGSHKKGESADRLDWKRVAYLVLASRRLDDIEENELMPAKKVVYQFSARGHDLAQIILGSLLDGKHDAAGAYYRSRPLLLTLGLTLEDAFAGPLRKSGGFSDGRDIGVVCNLPNKNGPIVLPMSGDVGSQYTPSVGWAQAITYHRDVLGDKSYDRSIAVVLGGEASVATNGFWSSLTIATTLKLPILFYIEDNGYGISVPGNLQTPGANIAENLGSFKNLYIREGDGSEPLEAVQRFEDVLEHVRDGKGPALLRLRVPRLCGHSGQDTQAYKSPHFLEEEKACDPLPKLKKFLIPSIMSEEQFGELEAEVERDVRAALEGALARPEPDPARITRYRFAEAGDTQQIGGLAATDYEFPPSSETPKSEAQRTNMLTAIRRTLEHELAVNPRVLVFGEDVGPKGGVHAATMGLQDTFGDKRVFDTSLSEEGIIGRSVGMAIAGLMPVAEIQFRKYADPATEQLNNCGTIRWRTANRFAAPIVVRMPGGFAKVGDPWHSVSSEVLWAHAIGWQMCFPSNAEDAVGLLRAALRSNNPTIFFEHRHLLDGPWARRPYPGDDYVLPMGKAKITQPGDALTVVTWGAMVERCELAAKKVDESIEIIDLRTISPWDRQAVLDSVSRTRRCLIVHEDGITAGFGAEVAATVAEHSFFNLDAPIQRLAIPDVPVPHNFGLMDAVVPTVDSIAGKMRQVIEA
ncbi:MAG TPA: transketolase C-terminal domain-containing protein [Gemmatimonadaceae bacterium]|nr:transketolase C-terminal domain-containing protein [Gemmatimonadaceae bacterium]